MEKKIKIGVTTRIEEENLIETAGESVDKVAFPDPDSIEDDELNAIALQNVDVDNSWETLYCLPHCHQVFINEKTQKQLGAVVGINVTQEFPWKQVKFKALAEYVIDEVDNSEELRQAFSKASYDDPVLIGYAPLLTQHLEDLPEGDPFVMYSTAEDTKVAASVIKLIETYERWILNKRFIKKPRSWVTQGSEKEVDLAIEGRKPDSVDVEIQSVYPVTLSADSTFQMRTTQDVRDGYIELVPDSDMKFENIFRRRMDAGFQSAPERVNLEQQTDPTFPTNAWSQYFYEIAKDDNYLDETSEDEDLKKKDGTAKQTKSKTPTPDEEAKLPPSPPEVSEQVKLMLSTLDFNQVDMYRNDYPIISSEKINHFTNPYLEEMFCFADMIKSNHRYACGVDWYPSLSGLVVISYTFSTAVTVSTAAEKIDLVQRSILQANPVLMWSFVDSLNYKFEFESPMETTAVSFCPSDGNLLLGGAKNGQVVLWDLQDRVKNLDTEEILTAAQLSYRSIIAEFLTWTIRINEQTLVPPTVINALDTSQTGPITDIEWLPRNFTVTKCGKVHDSQDQDNTFFLTSSIDGTIAFWNLSDSDDKTKSRSDSRKKHLPAELKQSESPYKVLNKVIRPVFIVTHSEPLSAIICDAASFCYTPMIPKNSKLRNFPIDVVPTGPKSFRKTIISASLFGRVEALKWEGYEVDPGNTVNKENLMSSASFTRVHNGPVVAMRKNPFYPELFASVGRNILAIWREDFPLSPILWRQRSCDLTSFQWSKDRPSVLFLTRTDGCMEAWDLLARADDSCLNEVLGGGIITSISEHGPSEPNKVLGIGDYNSSFRMVCLPESFYVPVPNELERLKEFINKEVHRKKSIRTWEHEWLEKNADILEAKKTAEAEAIIEMERLQETSTQGTTKQLKEDADNIIDSVKSPFAYTEKMTKKWDQINLRRLMETLMSRKMVNAEQLKRETVLEKQRLSYEAAKKASVKKAFKNIKQEIAAVRARILPVEMNDFKRPEMIVSSVMEVIKEVDPYDTVASELNSIIDDLPLLENITYMDFLLRGHERRQVLSKSLGGNTERMHQYNKMKNENLLRECNFGYDEFLNAAMKPFEDIGSKEESASIKTNPSYSDLDVIPVRDNV